MRIAGERLLAADTPKFPGVLNEVLNQFLGWPLRAATGHAIDSKGQLTDNLASLVFATSAAASANEPVQVNSDSLACAIDVYETIDAATLRAACEKIARVKRLRKTEAPRTSGFPTTTVTLGIIVARDSVVPLDVLAEELDSLNRKYPDREWPEMLVILSKGTISYTVQFPGEHVLGDMLPPAEGALGSVTPPWYVILSIKPTREYTFNRMLGYLLSHLTIFSPGAKLPNWHEVLEGTPKEIITVCGYQYNLAGRLLPVPRQFYNDRYLPPRPIRVEDKKGTLLAALQFLPWQDGGVILLKGKLPLDGLMVFLGKDVLKRGGTVKRPPDVQISYVLPISQADFGSMMERIQRQSNMIVRADPTKFVVQKFADEGSSSPFMARLFMGILRLRDAGFTNGADRDKFDKTYDFVMTNLLNARTSAQDIQRLVREHVQKVSDGTIARMAGSAIQVDEAIDKTLRKELDAFLNSAVRVLKQGTQELATSFNMDLGFLFQKSTTFENGLSALSTADAHLAAYLGNVRSWSERLVESRNDIEHRGWTLPRIKYSEQHGGIRAEEPQVSNQPVSEFVPFIFDRLTCFVDEFTSHCLQARMPSGISITEIPLSEREPEAPERFRLTLTHGGMPVWQIACHQTSFEQT